MIRRIARILAALILNTFVISSLQVAAQTTDKPGAKQKAAGPASENSAQTSNPDGKDPKGSSNNSVGGGSETPPTKPATDQADPAIYRIGIEDELQISVWKEPELSVNAVVRPDGMITMPLLNDVYVVGLKPLELQAILGEKLKPIINEPQVTVIVRGIRSRKVYVYGQVMKAGAYVLITRKTIMEVISEAGGLGPFAKKRSIYVLREVDGKKVKIPFNFNDALKGKGDRGDIELLPGDIVVVP